MFKKILVPTDGSAPAARAIKQAVRLAREQDAEIVGFYVGPPWSMPVYGEYLPPEVLSEEVHVRAVKDAADRYLREVRNAAAAAGVKTRCYHVLGEHPHEEILKAARQNHCDLIVIASHGRRGLSRLLLGSETSKVLARSRLPVMVCR
jgi:nucleotide-binding universal stress UspA family protein